ncbi:hypothetical protein ALI144C_02595 [Actinosynnema sp. ALI-1.44]|nr:hypothetical protein ALI144C_02595 [Actinosynnema sp. ALI-1.44]
MTGKNKGTSQQPRGRPRVFPQLRTHAINASAISACGRCTRLARVPTRSDGRFARIAGRASAGLPDIGRDELFRFFTLRPADLAFVDPGRGRGPADRLD